MVLWLEETLEITWYWWQHDQVQHLGLRYVTRCITWDFALWLDETLAKSESTNETMTRCITWVSTLLIPEEPQITLLISTCPVPTAQRRTTSEKKTGMTRWITWVSTFLTWTEKTQLQWASRYFNEHQCSGGDDRNYTWCREKLGRSPVRVRTSDTRAQWRCGSNHILLMKTSYVHGSDLLRHSHVVRQFLTIIYHSNKLLQRHYYLELVPLCVPPLTSLDSCNLRIMSFCFPPFRELTFEIIELGRCRAGRCCQRRKSKRHNSESSKVSCCQ